MCFSEAARPGTAASRWLFHRDDYDCACACDHLRRSLIILDNCAYTPRFFNYCSVPVCVPD
jgi:hypothetical protein